MVKGGLISIREAFHSLTPMEQQAARYILDHPELAVQCSIQKLAEEAEVSKATLIRLSQSLKYKGFKELKIGIASDVVMEQKDTNEYQQFQMKGTPSELLESISNNNIKSIKDTLAVLDADAVEQAINTLSSARKIALFGIESSSVVADDFRYKAVRLGLWCEPGYSEDAQTIIAANLTDADAVLAISFTGQTQTVLEAMKLARQNGAKLISLTQFGINPIAQLAEINLFSSTVEKDYRNGAMASRIAQLNVIDILYVGLVDRNYDAHIEALDRTRKAVHLSRTRKSN